jgi:hypothetical protein
MKSNLFNNSVSVPDSVITDRDPDYPPVSKFTLTFADQSIRKEFEQYATTRSLTFVRVSIALAILLYIAFAFLDPLIMPTMVWKITAIRIMSILFFLGILYLTYTSWGFKNFQFLMCIVVLFASTSIIGMILLSESTGGYLYYAALILAIIYAHNLLRLRFIYATFTTWAVIWFYAIATLLLETTPSYIYLNNMFFLVSANILGMFASYWLEYYMKSVFWKERILDEKTQLLETEYNRKSEELDAARDIQLSLLPQASPHIADYRFSFSMNPASEVGGDYYDYVIGEDGSVTFAIGDATGHGLQASVMVTAIKLLFTEHAGKTELTEFLKRASRSISLMGFRKIFLAFAIGRLHNDTLQFAGAGMPPALVYRQKTGTIDEVSLKGFPLGSSVAYPYQKSETRLEPGDTVLLMTDGFPELHGLNGEMIGYEKVRDLFSASGDLPPDKLIQHLNRFAGSWLNGSPQNDDLTFFAIQRVAKSEPECTSGNEFSGYSGSNKIQTPST